MHFDIVTVRFLILLSLYRTEMHLFIFHGLTTDDSLHSEHFLKIWSHSQGGNNMIQYYEDTHMLPGRSHRVHMQQPRTLSFSGSLWKKDPGNQEIPAVQPLSSGGL